MNAVQPAVLVSALDAIDEAIGVYSADDRLVAFNDRYGDLRSAIGGDVGLGVRWDELILASLRKRTIAEAIGREDAWLDLRRRARGAYSVVRRLPDGRHFQVNERRTLNRGIAVVWTEITRFVQPPARASGGPNVRKLNGARSAELVALAQQWRQLARHADPVHRDIYLAFAATCERQADC